MLKYIRRFFSITNKKEKATIGAILFNPTLDIRCETCIHFRKYSCATHIHNDCIAPHQNWLHIHVKKGNGPNTRNYYETDFVKVYNRKHGINNVK